MRFTSANFFVVFVFPYCFFNRECDKNGSEGVVVVVVSVELQLSWVELSTVAQRQATLRHKPVCNLEECELMRVVWLLRHTMLIVLC